MVLVGEGEPLGLGDLDRVEVVDNPLVGETDTDGDDLAVCVAEGDLAVSAVEGEELGDVVVEGSAEGEKEGEALAVDDENGGRDGVRVALGEPVRLGETDALSVAEAAAPLAATLRVALGEPERLGEPEALRVTLGEPAARLDERDGEADPLGEGEQTMEMARTRLLARSTR